MTDIKTIMKDIKIYSLEHLERTPEILVPMLSVRKLWKGFG